MSLYLCFYRISWKDDIVKEMCKVEGSEKRYKGRRGVGRIWGVLKKGVSNLFAHSEYFRAKYSEVFSSVSGLVNYWINFLSLQNRYCKYHQHIILHCNLYNVNLSLFFHESQSGNITRIHTCFYLGVLHMFQINLFHAVLFLYFTSKRRKNRGFHNLEK